MARTLHIGLSATLSLFLALIFAVSASGADSLSSKAQIANASTVGELHGIYKSSENAIIRRGALQALSRINAREGAGLTKGAATQERLIEQEKLMDLLDKGLADSHVSVVKETIRQIGNLRMVAYSGALADLFHSADRNYPGSQKEVRMEVIAAIGKIGGPDARMVFREVLAQGVANSMSTKALQVVREMGDASLTDAVRSYAEIIDASLKAMPDTPEHRPRRAQYQEALALARSVEKTLLTN
jgi:hypothetical protein